MDYREALRSCRAVLRSLDRCKTASASENLPARSLGIVEQGYCGSTGAKPPRLSGLLRSPSGLWSRIKIAPPVQNRLVSVDYREALRGCGAGLRSLRRCKRLVSMDYREALRSCWAGLRSLSRCKTASASENLPARSFGIVEQGYCGSTGAKPPRLGGLPRSPSGLWSRIKIAPPVQNRLVSMDYREAPRSCWAGLRSLSRCKTASAPENLPARSLGIVEQGYCGSTGAKTASFWRTSRGPLGVVEQD